MQLERHSLNYHALSPINGEYLASAQIDPERHHMFITVPIYSENRYVFVKADTKEISMVFCGTTWHID